VASNNTTGGNELLLTAGRVRVRFALHEDRFAHQIWLLAGGDWTCALSSVEGTPDQHWPPSPPLQTLHIETRPTGPVALLVGMAGKSHWSASIEAQAVDHRLGFDLASRARAHRELSLGTTYQVSAGFHLLSVAEGRLLATSPDGSALEIAAAPGARVEVDGVDRVRAVPRQLPAGDAPATICWNYHLALAGRQEPRDRHP
jgi:hypothetical protein